jgi:hypothetical protein
MKILRLISIAIQRGFYLWAMREINPAHQDVPGIVLRQRQLKDEWIKEFT